MKSLERRSLPAGLWLLLAASLAATVACGTGDSAAPLGGAPTPAATPAAEPDEKPGSLSFALTLREGLTFTSFTYAITGPNFAKSGSINVTNSTVVSALIEGIPPASGYSVTVMGKSTSPTKATCSGSATFAIAAGSVTEVPVAISCHLEQQPPPPPPPPAEAVPLPPFAPVAIGLFLLGIGGVSAGRRRENREK